MSRRPCRILILTLIRLPYRSSYPAQHTKCPSGIQSDEKLLGICERCRQTGRPRAPTTTHPPTLNAEHGTVDRQDTPLECTRLGLSMRSAWSTRMSRLSNTICYRTISVRRLNCRNPLIYLRFRYRQRHGKAERNLAASEYPDREQLEGGSKRPQ